MKIKVLTLFPMLIEDYLSDALLAKAIGQKLMEIEVINLRNFSGNNYNSVDDEPFGGGDGMLIRADVLERAILSIKKENQLIIYMTPQGQTLDSNFVRNLSRKDPPEELVIISGRYAGVDQRFIDTYVDLELSIGDYVLSGGELPALVLIEAVSRFIPGVLGKAESAAKDSFEDGLLEAPQYTRPQEWNGQKVPDVLVSGNHKKINEWKKEMALKITEKKRPELLKNKQAEPDK